MPKLRLLTESTILDDAGNMVMVWYVDLRDPSCQTPITTLIKGCCKQHAIEDLGTIRVSKPECFRKLEESLIWDISETRVSQSVMLSEQTDDPEDLKESQLFDDELEKCGKSIGEKIRSSTTSVKRTKKNTKTLTFGKNGWIYSTSIEPTNELETTRWQGSLLDEYDHIDRIYRPREFARSLGLMVTEQLGPHGKEISLKNSFSGGKDFHSKHKGQLIIHGPVIYSKNPYELISSTPSPEEMIFSIFVKDIKYIHQREYRFAIWTEEEPSEKCVDLKVSKSMLGSLQPYPRQPTGASPVAISINENPKTEKDSTEKQKKQTQEVNHQLAVLSSPMDGLLHDSLLDNLDNPSIPLVPTSYSTTDLPDDLDEAVAIYSVLKTLRRKVEQVETKRRPKVASAAWHAEPCIRSLCSTFVDPIASLSINDDNILVVEIKFPENIDAEAKIAFGPLGASTYTLKNGKEKTVSWGSPSKEASVTNSALRALSKSGLLLRTQPTE